MMLRKIAWKEVDLQVGRVVDGDAGKEFERASCKEEVLTNSNDRRVRIEPRNNGVHKSLRECYPGGQP